jgi:hypothetical protein
MIICFDAPEVGGHGGMMREELKILEETYFTAQGAFCG